VMIAVSIGFGVFPMHLYNVVRSGVDPLVARITHVVPIATQDREYTRQPSAVSHQLPPPRNSTARELTARQLKAASITGTP
jgi:NADH-quinone oxidoreductase subunit M